jgi:type IV pilus assembly protein PilX
MIIMKTRHLNVNFAANSKESGFVLIVALVVLAAMSLAAIALVRTVDTSTLLARNISFKRDAVNRNEIALEAANVLFRINGGIPGPLANQVNARTSQPALNYSSAMVATDPNGIPVGLGTVSTAFPGEIVTQENNRIHYIIERMCTRENAIEGKDHCLLAQAASGSEQPEKRPVTLPAMYRVTSRVAGARGVSSVTQAMIVPTILVTK